MGKKIRGFEVVKQEHRTLPDEVIKLPVRGTQTSAGYDFFATQDLVIKPQEKVMFKTDVKAYMGADEVLLIDVRSSIGSKKDLMITNTLGVIDSDYYENVDNDGNMMVGLRNLKPAMSIKGFVKVVDIKGMLWDVPLVEDLTEENTVVIKAGERVAQGIFVKYLEADNGNTKIKRTGGTGSTDKSTGGQVNG
ncbi:dUTP diphosphatase [Clostridium sporogenes]|uniref:dUTP diphosphatase n=1 Tax=Clostridium sporogenes TaxID=1509 RepID=UPI002238FF8C|nr:dUTP diphosphatase [Clostridium sporogenes]MCW6094592.1 dUTP diphosphatase [Clostridium sporogenes]